MLVISPRSGASGDMLLSALIDAGADERKVCGFLRRELGVKVRTEVLEEHHINARRLAIGKSNKHYTPNEMKRIITKSGLGKKWKAVALRCLETLVAAERTVHGTARVHFHELGHVDTLIDIMGCAFALELLGEERICSLPVACGFLAPATLQILKSGGFPFYVTAENMELTTPTGASLVTTIAEPVDETPPLAAGSFGWGLGNAKRKSGPNVLSVLRGEELGDRERIVILETNIDDASGEILAYAAERLLEEGAKDACLVPIIAKKGRPGAILRAICSKADAGRLTQIIFDETGTLGVRESECSRHVASRQLVRRDSGGEDARVKVGRFKGKVISSKAEFEDLKRIAKRKGKSIRELSGRFSR